MSLNETGQYEWNISNPSLLTQIQTARNGKQFVSETFELCSLNWKIEINPNGCNKQRIGSFDVFLKLTSISSKWQNITVCRTIDLPQTFSSFTAIDKYATKGESSGWPQNTLTFGEIANRDDLKKLTVIIGIQVIQIRLKRNNCVYYHMDFKCDKVQKINYKLDTQTLNALKQSKFGKRWTSPIYKKMWAIQIYPNGNNKSGKGKFVIALVVCALPANRSKIRVQWNVLINELNFRENKFNEFTLSKHGSTIRIATFDDFKKCVAFTLNVNVLIVKEYDNNGNDIMRSETNETKVDNTNIDDRLVRFDTKMNAFSLRMEELMECNRVKDEKIQSLQCKYDNFEKIMGEQQREINKLKTEVNGLKNVNANANMNNNYINPMQSFIETELKLPEYITLFVENGFEMDSLCDVSMDELKELGIAKMGHRKKILKCIQRRKNMAVPRLLSMSEPESEGGGTLFI